MTPVYQTRSSRPGRAGDCLECCIASMLDLTRAEVPSDFNLGVGEGEVAPIPADSVMIEWLARRKLGYIEIALPGHISEVQQALRHHQPGAAYVLTGVTANASIHAVVCRDGKVIHDPASSVPSQTVIADPLDNGTFRIGFIVLRC